MTDDPPLTVVPALILYFESSAGKNQNGIREIKPSDSQRLKPLPGIVGDAHG